LGNGLVVGGEGANEPDAGVLVEAENGFIRVELEGGGLAGGGGDEVTAAVIAKK
jgi:hypothetical protein